MYSRAFAVRARQRFVGDIERAVDDLFDGDLTVARRVHALWRLEGAPAGVFVHGRAIASLVGGLLDHPEPLVAREAFEVLCSLALDAPFASVDEPHALPELTIAVGVDRHGRLAVSPRSLARCERSGAHRSWCPDLDVEVVALVDVHRLQAKLSSPLGLLAGISGTHATTLLVAEGLALARLRREGRLGAEEPSPRARAERDGTWTLEAPSGGGFSLDGAPPVSSAQISGHHIVRFGGHALDVVVMPALPDGHRVIVDVPGLGYEAAAVGDAWFARGLPHARGHIAMGDKSALVVDLSASAPIVNAIAAGEGASFGPYDAVLDDNGTVLRLVAHRADGPDRARPAVRQATAAKRAA